MPVVMSQSRRILFPATRTRPRRINGGYVTCFSAPFCQILRNKVLVSVALTAVIGKFSKPFTSVIMHGRNFDFGEAFRPGGFPSTHSSAVVATAMTLGIERGFSDPIFGLTLVFACLIMYDAQGVRRQVGNHAKAINKSIFRQYSGEPFKEAVDSDHVGVPLKETVGHTKPEVIAGAVLGFLVSLAMSFAKFL